MNEKQPPQAGQDPLAIAGAQPSPVPSLPDPRRAQAWWGGMLAGIAIGVGLAVVMHVIEKLSPNSAANCGVGCGYGILNGDVDSDASYRRHGVGCVADT